MDDHGLLQSFFDESADLLADFEECLLRLETTPGDQELLNKSFRAIHTIKGNSGMLGFERIARVAHALEDLLDRLRRNEMPLTRIGADLLLRSADVIKGLFSEARGEHGEEMRADELIDALRAFLAGREVRARLEVPQAKTEVFDFVGEGGVGEISPATEESASVPIVKTGEVPLIGELLLEDRAVTPTQLDEALRKQKKVGEILVEDRAVSPTEVARALEKQAHALQKRESSTIRVSTEKIDKLVNLVGELVITQSMISQTVSSYGVERLPVLKEAVAQMERNLRELQERVMAVRMLPIRTVFGRFPRLVRDLAQQCGKEIAIEVKGEETELDKTVIEQIADPLTHLVRNAVDHGIELPEVRLALGKPRQGLLGLNAYHQGGNVYIEVKDDGKGLDRAKILRKAVELGAANEGDPLTDEQVFNFVFRPGFSTAERVTELSGRGVGLDVVRKNIEVLGGEVTIESRPHRGSTLRIKLPLTLAILDGLSVQVSDEQYIIPLINIVESIQPKRSQLRTIAGRGEVVDVRGRSLNILRLHTILGVTPRVTDPTQGLLVLVENAEEKVALLVDELLGQQQVVIKSLEANYRKVPGVSGATIMGDGRVALILDIPGLVRLASGQQVLRYAA